MGTLLAVALGGAFGAVARYGLGVWVQRQIGSAFPWGTFLVNATGSCALGFLMVWLRPSVSSPEAPAFLTVGVLGGYTTFSTFTWEAVAMLRDGEWARGLGYVGGSLLVGLAAVVAGAAAAQALLRAG